MQSILFFAHDLYEDLELWYPKIRLQEAGFKTIVAGPSTQTACHGKHGYPCTADIPFEAIDPKTFSGVVIPGGFAPDKLRRIPKVLDAVKQLHEMKRMIAFICHGGWVPISAKILRGKNVTSVSAIQDDLENAGAIFADKPVVVDANLISSRTPVDLPFFSKAMLEFLNAL